MFCAHKFIICSTLRRPAWSGRPCRKEKKSPLPCLVQERSSLGDDLANGFYNSASTFFLMLRMNMERQKNNQGEPCGPWFNYNLPYFLFIKERYEPKKGKGGIASVLELVDKLNLGLSGVSCKSSSLFTCIWKILVKILVARGPPPGKIPLPLRG